MDREIIRRLVPVIISLTGIVFFRWGISTFLLYFYVDSLFLFVFAFIKSGLAVQSGYIWKTVPYDPKATPDLPLRYIPLSLFCIFYIVSILITYFTVGFSNISVMVVAWAIIFSLASHGYDFVVFKSTELYKKVTSAFCIFSPFKRVFVFFLAAILGTQENYRFAVYALLFSQIVVELYFWNLERKHRS